MIRGIARRGCKVNNRDNLKTITGFIYSKQVNIYFVNYVNKNGKEPGE